MNKALSRTYKYIRFICARFFMLVLSGKKIKKIVIGLFAFFMIFALTLSSKKDNQNYIDTVSLPVSGKVVVIDARTR